MIYLEFIFQFKAFVVCQHQTLYTKKCQILTLLLLRNRLQQKQTSLLALQTQSRDSRESERQGSWDGMPLP